MLLKWKYIHCKNYAILAAMMRKRSYFVTEISVFATEIETPRTSRNKFHDWLEKTIEETTETKENNPETIEVRVFKNE